MLYHRKIQKRPLESATARPPFEKILVANRGEIACRVMQTCKRLGIATVAVYSDADADALHVRMADEAVRIGPPPSAQSYLLIEAIVRACRDTGADAVHPGYGFLSEKADFARALAEAGIVFIGPNIHAIGAMGDKIESKKLAQEAGVNSVPGYLDVIKDADEAVEIALGIGYPVMIKASAGGGGKGMRIARSDQEVRDGFRSATNEARSSFADDRVFIEKFIEEPRHIEIQVLGDSHGNCVYLGERECSIQRRHQKVIEEAPSPFIDPETRAAMGNQAVQLAKAVNYESAGTVEFIVDKNRNFYFLEMNTRLQVEHPVTEMITGLDLVEMMIRVAAGEKLPFRQEDIDIDGWAIEARVYAEDPVRNFLPSIGRLVRYRPPEGHEGIRIDTGIYEGGEISVFYDPMIAKLVAYGNSRWQAISRLSAALDAFYLRGLRHNIDFLAAIAAHPRFKQGRLSTGFIAEEFGDGFSGVSTSSAVRRMLVAVAAVVQRRTAEREAGISGQLPGHEVKPGLDYVVRLEDETHTAHLTPERDGFDVHFEDLTFSVRTDWVPGEGLLQGLVNNQPVAVQIDRWGSGWRLAHAGAHILAQVLPPRSAALAAYMLKKAEADTSRFLLSPMPGLLKSVAVQVGDDVKSGQELAVVEAMKMENILRSERDGKIGRLHAAAGDSLAVDQKILEFE